MKSYQDLLSHFHFHTLPFTREIAVKERFACDLLNEPLAFLRHVIEQRMSATLIAPAGTGKTVLLRALRDGLPPARYHLHYIKVTDLSQRDFCRELSYAVGCESAGNYPAMVRRLQERFSTSLAGEGMRPVLFIDEAHEMRPTVLGLIRVLTNFNMDSELVLSLVLAGQPPLKKMLQDPKHQDIATRLAHCATLRTLSRTELKHYVAHRCHIAGADTELFDSHAQEALYEISSGNLRATDHLALKALELAYQSESSVVDAQRVIDARKWLCL